MDLDVITIEQCADPTILVSEAKQVDFPLNTEIKSLITAMKKKVINLKGVGLAAPQVNYNAKIIVYVISDSAAAIRNNAKETVPVTVLINPHYKPVADAITECDWEGCFSVTELTGKVPRYNRIEYTYFDEQGNKQHDIAEGFTARVLQHEIDHINGILIKDRLTAGTIHGHPRQMTKLRMKELDKRQRAELQAKLELEKQQGNLDEKGAFMLACLEDLKTN